MAEERHHAERLSPADASNVVMDAPDQVNCFLMAGILGSGGFVGPDGAAGARLVPALFDPLAPGEPDPSGKPSPSGHPGVLATARPAAPRRSPWRAFLDGVVRVSAMFRSTIPPTVLLGPIGAHRGVAAVSYAGRLGVAAHIDADALDLERVRRALDDELHRIVALR